MELFLTIYPGHGVGWADASPGFAARGAQEWVRGTGFADKVSVAMGPYLYGFTFVVIVPVLLGVYAHWLDGVIALPLPPRQPWGTLSILIGAIVMCWAMVDLRRIGGGLPMNAFPPPRYVTRGVYRYIGHPIYVGFVILSAGVSLSLQSAAGLYWVTPFAAAAAAALVWGYEGIDLDRRFGSDRPRPITALPASRGGIQLDLHP